MTRRLIMSILHFQPIKGQVRTILRAILNTPEVSSCCLKVVLTLRLVCEEIVMNVTSYAYPEGTEGYLDVDIQKVAVSSGHQTRHHASMETASRWRPWCLSYPPYDG